MYNRSKSPHLKNLKKEHNRQDTKQTAALNDTRRTIFGERRCHSLTSMRARRINTSFVCLKKCCNPSLPRTVCLPFIKVKCS